VNVRLPTMLESYAGGTRDVQADGDTVDELLRDLDVRYPGIRFRMINEQDQLRPHMKIFINRESINRLDTPVTANDEVVILQSLSGG
jgi:molybdopterin converting factor small subunit